MRLLGKTALVTGSNANIGRGILLELAREGANVIVNGLTRRTEAELVAEEARQLGATAVVRMADVSDRDQVFALVEEIRERFGGVDILVNNVGARPTQTILDASFDDWRRVLRTDLYGSFHCCQAVLPGMVGRGWGRIINMSSRNGFTGVKGRIHEATSKAAVHGLTRTLAVEFADRGITVNSIAPGAQNTHRNPAYFANWYWNDTDRRRQTPVGRLGETWEVGRLCAFLGSDDAGFISGTLVQMSGAAAGNIGGEALLYRSPRGPEGRRNTGAADSSSRLPRSPSSPPLDGRVAFVTGGGRNLGAAIARALAHDGADVAIGAFEHPEEAEAVAAELTATGHRAIAATGDVARPEAVSELFDGVEARLGPVDILVNNAAVSGYRPFLQMDVDEWDRVLRVNLDGPFLCAKEMATRLVSRGAGRTGRIINVSARDAMTGAEGMAHVTASKMGIQGLTRCLAHDLAQFGVTVNAIAPGAFATSSLGDWYPSWDGPAIASLTPLGRLGDPKEIGWLCAFLASDNAAFITGQVIQINGGLDMATS